MMSRRALLITAVLLLLLLMAGAGLWLYSDDGQPPGTAEADAEAAVIKPQLGAPREPFEVGSAAGESAQDDLRRAGVGADDATELGKLTGNLLAAYQAGDASAFRQLLESQGLQPDTRSDEDWMRQVAHFVGANFYPEHASWSALLVRGAPVTEEARKNVVSFPGELYIEKALDAPRGPNDVVDARQAGATQVRLRLPAELKDAYGAATLCQVELTFTRRPSDGQWLLTRSALRNVPKEHYAITAPPIR